jgi:peptidoglycan/LPS O-acetylase OafA/YrhL
MRRARRLLPITVLGLGSAAATTVVAGTPDMVADLRGDVLSVVGYVSNWRFLAVNRSYGALFERPSAFQHYWSLSLEEQCFVALPVVVAAALAIGGRRRAAWITGIVGAVAAAIPAFVAHTPDAAYYGTHVRAGEFLAGVTLALFLDRHDQQIPPGWHRAVQGLGAVCLGALAVVMVTVDRDLPWLYRGGLGLFALPAVAVIAAASERHGPVPRLLGGAPLAAVGRAAFPIYVLHWPLFVLVRARDLTINPAIVVTAELTVAVLAGLAVHHWLERPLLPGGIRPTAAWATERRVVAGSVTAMIVVVTAVALAPHPAPQPVYDFAEAERRANTTPTTANDERPAVALFGGSTAVSLGAVAFDWASDSQRLRIVGGSSQLGCGVLTQGRRITASGHGGPPVAQPPDDYCRDWQTRWQAVLAANNVNLAVMFGGVWETTDWLLDDTDQPTDITDPAFAELVHTELTQVADILSADGRHALLATTPLIGPGRTGHVAEERGLGPDQRRRVDTYNQLVRQVAANNEHVDVLDYGDYIDNLDPATNIDWLPDGIHPTTAAALAIWDQCLGHTIIDRLPPAPATVVAGPPEPDRPTPDPPTGPQLAPPDTPTPS